jgi:hypothetical protein
MPNIPIHPHGLRKAFTFAEIMFAVVILGIGFIMLAGMFPVAIQETRSTQSESYANPMIQNAISILTQEAKINARDPELIGLLTTVNVPYDIIFSPADYPDSLSLGTLPSWKPNKNGSKAMGGSGIQGNLISKADNRYAWTPLYRYRRGDNLLEVTLFACEAFDVFTSPDQLIPRKTTVTFNGDITNPLIAFSNKNEFYALSPGNYIVVGKAPFPTQIFRLANRSENSAMCFELYPDCGTVPAAMFGKSFDGWIIATDKMVRDISVVTTCIPVAPWTPPY